MARFSSLMKPLSDGGSPRHSISVKKLRWCYTPLCTPIYNICCATLLLIGQTADSLPSKPGITGSSSSKDTFLKYKKESTRVGQIGYYWSRILYKRLLLQLLQVEVYRSKFLWRSYTISSFGYKCDILWQHINCSGGTDDDSLVTTAILEVRRISFFRM